MGDAGSMLLGMLLAIATIEGIGKNLTQPSGRRHRRHRRGVGVPFLVLLIPASTSYSRSSAGRGGVRASAMPTRSTCTTDSWSSGTGTGRRCC